MYSFSLVISVVLSLVYSLVFSLVFFISLGLSPLHIASMWGRVETIDVLLDNGADVTLKDHDDRSALDYAEHAEERRYECMDALTRYRENKGKAHKIRDHPQIRTTKLVALGLGNPSMSVPHNGEWPGPGSLVHVIHGPRLPKVMLMDQSE